MNARARREATADGGQRRPDEGDRALIEGVAPTCPLGKVSGKNLGEVGPVKGIAARTSCTNAPASRAAPIAPPHSAAQMGEGYDRAVSAAQAALDKATKMHSAMMMRMDSMMKMPMSANEKAMMHQMQQMTAMIQDLVDTNKQLLEANKELRKSPELTRHARSRPPRRDRPRL